MKSQVLWVILNDYDNNDDQHNDVDDHGDDDDSDDCNDNDNDDTQPPYDWATEGAKPIPASLYKANMSTR